MLNNHPKEEEFTLIEEKQEDIDTNKEDEIGSDDEVDESENEDKHDHDHEASNENKDQPAKKRTRRKRRDLKGREFSCKCGKAYLSIIALKGHQRAKHKNKPKDGSSRKRGRPKKYIFTDDYPKEQVFFFEAKNRKPYARNPIVISTALNAMASLIDQLSNKGNNNLIALLKEYKPIAKPLDERSTDDVIYEYLLQTKHLTNEKFYELTLKVLLLLREYFNKTNNDSDYSINHPIENLPLIANAFLDDYLLANKHFGLNASDQAEIPEIVLNFSLWIHENGYSSYVINKTSSKDNQAHVRDVS